MCTGDEDVEAGEEEDEEASDDGESECVARLGMCAKWVMIGGTKRAPPMCTTWWLSSVGLYMVLSSCVQVEVLVLQGEEGCIKMLDAVCGARGGAGS